MTTHRDQIELRIRKLDRAIEAVEDLPTGFSVSTKFVESLKRQRDRLLSAAKVKTGGECRPGDWLS